MRVTKMCMIKFQVTEIRLIEICMKCESLKYKENVVIENARHKKWKIG